MAHYSDYNHRSPRHPFVREGPPILYNPPGYQPPPPRQRTPSSAYSQPPFIPPSSPPRQLRQLSPPSESVSDAEVGARPVYHYNYIPRRCDLPARPQAPQLNVLLQPPFSGKPPQLKFDLQAPLDSLALGSQSKNARISSTVMSEPATEPGVEVMQLESDILPWPIVVHCFPGQFVTLGNVLNTVYGSLRYPISKSEAHTAKISKPANLDSATAQAEHRAHKYRARKNSQSSSADYRLLRVDWLLRNTIFHGLVPDESRQTWKMRLVARPVVHRAKR